MSITSDRNIDVTFIGDGSTPHSTSYLAAQNADSPATSQAMSLTTGNNTITVPQASTATAVTIVKPSDNTAVITLKGVNGDTGVKLHLTDPDTISLDPTVASFVLNVSGSIDLRLVWT